MSSVLTASSNRPVSCFKAYMVVEALLNSMKNKTSATKQLLLVEEGTL